MTATARPLLPFDSWASGDTQPEIPVNDNFLRSEVIARPALGFITSLPGSPDDGDLHVLSAAIGEEVAGTLAIYYGGTWYYWVPYVGMFKRIGATDYYTYDPDSSDEWQIFDPSGSAVSSVNGGTGDVVTLQALAIAFSDETTAITTGTAKATFHVPYDFTLAGDKVMVGLTTPQTGGSIFTVDVNVAGSTILSTKATIDNSEETTLTAATPPVCTATTLTKGQKVTIDVDQVGDGTAKGGKVYLIGYPTP